MIDPLLRTIGRPGVRGPAFAKTRAGDQIYVFAIPPHWHGQEAPSVMISVNLHAAQLTAAEARRLASELLHHAASAEEDRA